MRVDRYKDSVISGERKESRMLENDVEAVIGDEYLFSYVALALASCRDSKPGTPSSSTRSHAWHRAVHQKSIHWARSLSSKGRGCRASPHADSRLH